MKNVCIVSIALEWRSAELLGRSNATDQIIGTRRRTGQGGFAVPVLIIDEE